MTAFHDFTPTPPMGWNSWDCFGSDVTESEVKLQADYMAEKMLVFGYQYLVVDIQWYDPRTPRKGKKHQLPNMDAVMDEWGRFLPDSKRFPSATGNNGFKPLADYIHQKGLKFGIHIMRGIPRQAVLQQTMILGTQIHANEIVDLKHSCKWCLDCVGIDTTKPGSQEYYNSLFNLYADWGVDFVKIDDMSHPYHENEAELSRKAIDQCGRPMVLSFSPGPAPVRAGTSLRENANMWRISTDVWDRWWNLYDQFGLCNRWAKYVGDGVWPDADMLPFGAIRARSDKFEGGWTNLAMSEQITMMTLWTIFRSPLMFSGYGPKNDAFTESLLFNEEVLQMHKDCRKSHQLFRKYHQIAWVATDSQSADIFLALFNLNTWRWRWMEIPLKKLGLTGSVQVRDLWAKKDRGIIKDSIRMNIQPHGAGLYRLNRCD
jgi:alpha-galactosidase